MAWCPTTRAYIERRTADGKSKAELRRCLKRYIARELFKALISRNSTSEHLQNAA
ncbi:hypothetical protein FHR32_005018 [Streptosporangium album]|uniref:Transposase IS116/IS110/IS902 family protein n=2 Tax=Streptosporangium album TaxID=47479 RepID=A0A7W7RYK6_9ACTN|nr:hypothetical protein [Streptosporangium album]